MVRVIIVRNPFNVRESIITSAEWTGGSAKEYGPIEGNWTYAVNGLPVDAETQVKDGDELVIMPAVGKKAFGWILTIGIAVLSAGVGAGIIGSFSVWGRLGISLAISLIGNTLVNKLAAPPKADLSDSEQSNTYGWNGMQTVATQGGVLPIVYGTVKTAGTMLQRHVYSNGKNQYLNVLYCVAEGPLDDITDIKLNSNPIENYSGCAIHKRMGDINQSIISNFNDSYADVSLSYELNAGGAWSDYLLPGNATQGIELTISFPAGLYRVNDKGHQKATGVTLQGQYRLKDGEWKDFGLGRVEDNTNSATYRVYRKTGLPAGQYEVRVRCTGKDGSGLKYANKVQWIAATQIIPDDFIHPGKALVGLQALATDQLSGSDPNFTCLVTRKHIYAFNPAKNAYEAKAADNPAWAAYDILHHCLRLNGEYVADGVDHTLIDYYAFEAWASKCEDRGVHFNYLYDSAMKLYDALSYPCRVGRGAILQVGTHFSCVYDYADEPTQLFTVANIKRGSFKEEFQAVDSRANCIEVSFINAEKDYERDVLTVYGEDYDRDGMNTQPTQIELMGCTSAAEAYKYGKFKLRENHYEIRTVTFDAFVDAIACSIGDVILVQSDVTSWGIGGRVTAVDGNNVTLDKEPDGDETTLLTRSSTTDKILTTNITKIDGTVLTLEETTGIAAGDIYAVGKSGKEAKKFKVLSIENNMNEETRTITAIEYYPEIYDDSGDSVPEIIKPDTAVEAPKDLTINMNAYSAADGRIVYEIHLAWRNPKDPNPIHVEVAPYGSAWKEYAVFSHGENTYTFTGAEGVDYSVRIYAENEIGRRSSYVTGTATTTGNVTSAEPVTDLHVYNRYRQTRDGVTRYDICVGWNPADKKARVYIKRNHAETESLQIVEEIAVEDLQDQIGWIYAGEGIGQLVIPQGIPGETYTISVCTADGIGNYVLPENGVQITDELILKTTIPNTPGGFGITFGNTSHVSWEAVSNTDISFYELRTNANAGGESDALLIRTNDVSADVSLESRSGKLYLFACGTDGKYSTAATLEYNKPTPKAPATPQVNTSIGGLSVSVPAIPANCNGMNIYITKNSGSTVVVHTANSVYTCSCDAGIYDVQVAYTDIFGEGPKSDTVTFTVKVEIDQSMIKDGAISIDKIDKNLKEVFSTTIPSIESDVSDIQNTTIPAIESNVSKIQNTTIPAIESNVSKIQNTTIPSIESDITTLQNGITENTNSITAIEKDVSGNATAINQNATDITSLAKTVNGNTTAINQNATSITSLAKTVNGNTTAINQNATDITSLAKTVDGNTTAINQNANDITSLSTTVSGNTSAIAQNSDSITALVKDGKGYASAIAQNSTSITAVVANLNTKDGYKNYTALSQLDDAINLRVEKNDVINQINMTSETTTIDGKHLHVTGNTVFDKNVVVSGMIQAGAVTADKLSVDSLSAITATIGTLRTKTSGARTEIHDNLIEVYDENNVLRVRMGVW